MADVLTPQQRSLCMSRNRGKDTKPEILLRHELWHRGLRYRLSRRLTGKPDIVFVSARLAVFVDGCFWHGCPEHSTEPKTNSDFWREKIAKNKMRDREVTQALGNEGWRVVRYWEHQIKSDTAGCADQIEQIICKNSGC